MLEKRVHCRDGIHPVQGGAEPEADSYFSNNYISNYAAAAYL